MPAKTQFEAEAVAGPCQGQPDKAQGMAGHAGIVVEISSNRQAVAQPVVGVEPELSGQKAVLVSHRDRGRGKPVAGLTQPRTGLGR